MNSIPEEKHNIHWFPGHMMRTLRNIEKKLPQVDAVVHLLDARIPHSSLNPELQLYYKNKPRLYIMNKADLADDTTTLKWIDFFENENSVCIAINSKQKGSAKAVKPAVESALKTLLEHRKEKGISGTKIRLMVTGIPNVGKSTFINNWIGGAKAKAADRPGVTRGEQWFNAGTYELLDMPGVLWRRFETKKTAVNLALIGSIPDTLLNVEEIAAVFLQEMSENYFERLEQRYKLQGEHKSADGWVILENIGRKRGMLISGGEIDFERTAIMVLDEFRSGKLGKISLELSNG